MTKQVVNKFVVKNLAMFPIPIDPHCEAIWTAGFADMAGVTNWKWYHPTQEASSFKYASWAIGEPDNLSGGKTLMFLKKFNECQPYFQ